MVLLQVIHHTFFSWQMARCETAIKKVYSNMVDLNNPWTWMKVVEERARLSEMRIASTNNMMAIA
jgi:hypothetical protein